MRLIILPFLFLLISCGQEGTPWNPKVVKIQNVAPAEGELYTYEFKSGTCTTGLQEHATLNGVCNALLDDDLNNNCQRNKRMGLYNTNCI